MGIRAVIFDLDGVLTDTADCHYQAWKRLADDLEIPFSRSDNERLRGVSRRESLDRLLGDHEATDAEKERYMAQKNADYQRRIASLTPDDLLPGARALLDAVAARGCRRAVASASKNARTVLDALELASEFDAIRDGHAVDRPKPAPDLFLATADALEVEPTECAVIEDAEAGVQAALAAGMLAIGIGPAERVGGAHHRYDTVVDVDVKDWLGDHSPWET